MPIEHIETVFIGRDVILLSLKVYTLILSDPKWSEMDPHHAEHDSCRVRQVDPYHAVQDVWRMGQVVPHHTVL